MNRNSIRKTGLLARLQPGFTLTEAIVVVVKRMKAREGLTMIELTVAVTFLGVVLTSVAGLMVESARRTQVVAGQSRRQAAVTEEVDRLTTLPWSALTPGSNVCRTVDDPGFSHSRCVSVAAITTFMRRVTLVVAPTQQRLAPDTVIFIRANAPALNPLKTQ